MKESFYKIVRFKYENCFYILLRNKDHKYFFVKEVLDKYTHVTDDEFHILHGIFSKRRGLSCIEGKWKLVPAVIVGGTVTFLTASTLLAWGIHKKVEAEYQDFLERSKNIAVSQDVFPDFSKEDIKGDIKDFVSDFVEDFKNESDIESNINNFVFESSSNDIDDNIEFEYAYEYEDDSFVVKTIDQSDLLKYKYIYDFDYIDELFNYDNVTYNDFVNIIESNSNISKNMKPYVLEYVGLCYANSPEIDLRILYENMKTLKIIEADEHTIRTEALSVSALAVFLKKENTIYVNENNDYANDYWSYQILMHELTHAAKCYYTTLNDYEVQVKTSFDYNFSIILEEALVSYYSVRIFDKEEKDIAYQLQSNYISLLMDCINDYKLQDIVEKDITYFISKIPSNDISEVVKMFELLNVQYQDFYDDRIKVEQPEFYPLYDFMTDVYFSTHLNINMSYDECLEVYEYFIYSLTFDVPDEYDIDVDYFKSNFESYYKNHISDRNLSR